MRHRQAGRERVAPVVLFLGRADQYIHGAIPKKRDCTEPKYLANLARSSQEPVCARCSSSTSREKFARERAPTTSPKKPSSVTCLALAAAPFDKRSHYSRIERTASSASATTAGGARSILLNVRARASMVRVWSHSTMPWVLVPEPMRVTLKPVSREALPPWVIGATNSSPDALLNASAERTSAGRDPRISRPRTGSRLSSRISPRPGSRLTATRARPRCPAMTLRHAPMRQGTSGWISGDLQVCGGQA